MNICLGKKIRLAWNLFPKSNVHLTRYYSKLSNSLVITKDRCWCLFRDRQPETVFVPQMFVPENGRRARLCSRANHFHYSIEKRCCQLGRFVSFNEIHVLYTVMYNGYFLDFMCFGIIFDVLYSFTFLRPTSFFYSQWRSIRRGHRGLSKGFRPVPGLCQSTLQPRHQLY